MSGRFRKTNRLTLGAIFTALGVLLLWLGSFLEVLDASTAILASLLTAVAVLEWEPPDPIFLWLGTSILGLFLLPQKSPAFLYAIFAGYYPILKKRWERKYPPFFAWIFKLLLFHGVAGASLFAVKLFFPALLSAEFESGWMLLGFYLLALLCFVLYDLALSRLILFYFTRLRSRLPWGKR